MPPLKACLIILFVFESLSKLNYEYKKNNYTNSY